MSYSPYQPMRKDAQPRRALWRLALGLVTVFAVTALWIVGLIALAGILTGTTYGQAAISALGGNPSGPLDNILYLLAVVGIGAGTLVAAALWHRRGPRSLIGPGARTLRHFTLAALATWSVALAVGLLVFPFLPLPVPNLDLVTWLTWAPLALVAIALQTGSEELLFRGYLQSQLAARFARPAVWLALPAVLFGFLHFIPFLPLPAALTYVMITALFGLLAGDLTARTGSLGAAWGFHFANNVVAILFVATAGSLSGLGLFRSEFELGDFTALSPAVIPAVLTTILVWALIRRILRV